MPSSREGIILWTDCSSACGNPTAPGGSEGDQPSTGSGTAENAPTDDTPGQSDEFLGLFNTNTTLPKTVLRDESSVKITATGLIDAAYSVDLQLTLQNNSGKALTIGDAYGSLSVNGFMTDYSYYNQELGDRQSAVIGIKLWESSLADNQISPVSDIQEMEFGLGIKAGNTTIDEPTLALMLEESDREGPALKTPTSIEQHQAKELKKSMQQAYPFLTGPQRIWLKYGSDEGLRSGLLPCFQCLPPPLAPEQKKPMFSGAKPPKARVAISKNRAFEIFQFQRPYHTGKPIREPPPIFIVPQ